MPEKSINFQTNHTQSLARIVLDHTGLVVDCVACHDGINATGKSITHVVTEAPCETCHVVSSWFIINSVPTIPVVAAFDHTPVAGMPCLDCHDNVIEQGKAIDHVVSSDICEECHTTDTWFIPTTTPAPTDPVPPDPALPAPAPEPEPPPFDHTTVAGTPCLDCHDNVTEEGKPLNHIESADTCADCHTTDDWDIPTAVPPPPEDPVPADPVPADPVPPPFDHASVAGTPCLDCHDNVTNEGKPINHVAASDLCEECHTTDTWDIAPPAPPPAVASFDHSIVTGVPCFDCHNNITATGKSIGHILASDICEKCHINTSWLILTTTPLQASVFDHSTVEGIPCFECHTISF